jgi:hypothetical protein
MLLHWSLASGQLESSECLSSLLRLQVFPVGFSLLRAARWRLLLPGTWWFSGSPCVSPAADTSLALIN